MEAFNKSITLGTLLALASSTSLRVLYRGNVVMYNF
jgi:hypothetical protein